MKLLLDSCISKFAVLELREAGYHTEWVPDRGRDPGDEEILRQALEGNYILITLDKDFGELVFVFNLPHSAIIRLVDIRPKEQGRTIKKVIESHRAILPENPIITVDINRVRIRQG